MYQKYAIISAKKSRIKVSFLGKTGTLSLEVSAVFLTGKIKRSSVYSSGAFYREA